MKAKRYIAITLLLCLLAGLAACGTPEPTEPSTNPPTTTIDPTVPTTTATPTTVPATTVPPTTVPETTAPPETTVPYLSYDENGIPIYRFALCPYELDVGTFYEVVAEAKDILDNNEVFHLINIDTCVTFCNRISKYYVDLPDYVIWDVLSDYITIRRSDNMQYRRIQLYLVVLSIIAQKWEDCIIDHFKHDLQYRFEASILEGFRSSGVKYAYVYFNSMKLERLGQFRFEYYTSNYKMYYNYPGNTANYYLFDRNLASLNGYRPWTEALSAEIESAWLAKMGAFPGWYKDGDPSAMLHGVRCYGNYVGYEVLYVPSAGGGGEFLTYKDGAFIRLEDNGWIVSDRIIMDVHGQIEHLIRTEEQSWKQEESLD